VKASDKAQNVTTKSKAFKVVKGERRRETATPPRYV
jgi:hypothetical protein